MRSWLDPEWAGYLCREYADKLAKRCTGERGLFLTLTYCRDPYDGPEHCFTESREGRHVPRFIERLQKKLGRSLRGKWVCKTEFQEAGWVHFHLIILGETFIEHSLLQGAWGHGFVWVNPLNRDRVLYLAKYVAKGGNVPAFVHALRPRSFKVFRSSPGFWQLDKQQRTTENLHRVKLPWYVPVGTALEVDKHVHTVHDTRQGAWSICSMDLNATVIALRRAGVRVRLSGRWYELDCDFETLTRYAVPATNPQARQCARIADAHHSTLADHRWGRREAAAPTASLDEDEKTSAIPSDQRFKQLPKWRQRLIMERCA